MAGGIIPGIVRSKGGHFSVVGPVTPERIARIRKRVLKFRCNPGRKKMRCVPPVQGKRAKLADVKFPRFNLSASMIDFEWWMAKCDPLEIWTDRNKGDVLQELTIAAAVALRLAEDLKQRIQPWDGTRKHLDRLRRR
jgi:hypothetical protein